MYIICSLLDVLFWRVATDRLVEVVDCAADMDSQGSSSVTPLQSVNMLMHILPRYSHTHTQISLSVLHKNIQIHAAPVPRSHKHNDRQMSSLCLYCSHPPRRNQWHRISGCLCSRGKDAHFFILQFAVAGYGQSVALLPWNTVSGTSCMWLPGKASLHTHAKKSCTSHLRRFACRTDLFKHSNVFHFAGLEFRMHRTDRHAAYPEYCLSVSHSVSSSPPLILFRIFLLYIQ